MREPFGRVRSARHEFGAFFQSAADVVLDARALQRRDDRADLVALVERIADPHPADHLRRDPLHLVHARSRNEHPRVGEAGLSVVEETRLDRAGDGAREIGVVEDDGGRLAAQFERDALDRLRAQFADAPPRRRRSGERHHVDFGMRGQRLADHRAITRHEIEDARRQAGRIDHFGEQIGRERRHFRGLQHDGAARGERRRDLGRDQRERIIPRRDARHHADRLAQHLGIADGFSEIVSAEQLRRHAEVRDRRAGLRELRPGDRRADFRADQLRDFGGARFEALRDLREPFGALLRARARPAVEGGARGAHGIVGIARVTERNPADDVFRRRVGHIGAVAAVRLGPLAVDVNMLVNLHLFAPCLTAFSAHEAARRTRGACASWRVR